MKTPVNIGDKYNKLTVLSFLEPAILPCGQKNKMALCKCDCGNEKPIRVLHLKRDKIKSCGCEIKTRQGLGATKLCKVWRQMKSRCEERYFESHLYFKKRIKVCDEWYNDFNVFMKWSVDNGYTEGLVIDRKDGDKGYSPENCRWVTPKVNANNTITTKFVEYNGERIALRLLTQKLNIENKTHSIWNRLRKGWDLKKALETPIRTGYYHPRINAIN